MNCRPGYQRIDHLVHNFSELKNLWQVGLRQRRFDYKEMSRLHDTINTEMIHLEHSMGKIIGYKIDKLAVRLCNRPSSNTETFFIYGIRKPSQIVSALRNQHHIVIDDTMISKIMTFWPIGITILDQNYRFSYEDKCKLEGKPGWKKLWIQIVLNTDDFNFVKRT